MRRSFLSVNLIGNEGENHTREVASSAAATVHDIRVVVCQIELLLQLQTLNCLMKENMVEHGPKA